MVPQLRGGRRAGGAGGQGRARAGCWVAGGPESGVGAQGRQRGALALALRLQGRRAHSLVPV
jgi:hypothetical protein